MSSAITNIAGVVDVASTWAAPTTNQPGTSFRDHLKEQSAEDTPEKILQASKQFEALIIGQLLRTVHESGDGGWLGTGEDEAGGTAMQLAEESFAQSMANSGGFGVSKMIQKHLAKYSVTNDPT